MNKFILVLLISLVSCVKIEFDGSSLEKWQNDIFGNIESAIISTILKPIYKALYKAGHIDELVELIKKHGKPKAIELCTSWINNEKGCTSFVNELYRVLIK